MKSSCKAAGAAILFAIAFLTGGRFAEAQGQPAFGFADVQARAQSLASQPYKAPDNALPAEFGQMGYDQYQQIRFRAARSLLQENGSLFRAQLFLSGFLYRDAVAINVLTPGWTGPIAGSSDLFEWTQARLKNPPPAVVPLAGFRLHYPLHGPQPVDEVAAFLGASYFRLIGRGQAYGASARGLAVDTARSKEEFPAFREFWLMPPGPGATQMTFFALLDSPGVAGAYRFVLHPGARTRTEVTATLYLRHSISVFGLAPLTSMFFTGESSVRREPDFRPEVHDSDGLLMETGAGEHLWRPLANPRELQISTFADKSPRGFGLLQRDRDFDHYQDLQADYHRRPGLWVQPVGDWGEGAVQLIEIPTGSEVNDNIVAFWVPRTPVKGGDRIEIAYWLSALADEERLSPRGRAIATRESTASFSGAKAPERTRRLVVDFAGGGIDALKPDQPVDGDVWISSGRLIDKRTEPVPPLGAWRMTFDVEADGTKPIDMRAYLKLLGEPMTETWTYRWQP